MESVRNLDLVYLGGDQESIFLRSFPGDSKASHLWAALRNFCRKGSWIKKKMVKFLHLTDLQDSKTIEQLLTCDNCWPLFTLKEAEGTNCIPSVWRVLLEWRFFPLCRSWLMSKASHKRMKSQCMRYFLKEWDIDNDAYFFFFLLLVLFLMDGVAYLSVTTSFSL